MQPPPKPRAGLTQIPSFEDKLENEEEILEVMLAALGKEKLDGAVWQTLHDAAVRDERVSELAFAYESVSQGKRVKILPPVAAAEFYFRAATFFADVLGDEFGGRSYLDKAMTASPAHPGAFQRLADMLERAGDEAKLGELYAQAAAHRPKAEQVELLRRAGRVFDKLDTNDDKAIEIYTQLLRVDPADEDARSRLESRYSKLNRHRDVARLLEQALTTDPPPAADEIVRLRARLVDLYAHQLHEPERSMPHVEALLAHDPAREDALRVAEKLLANKALAGRAAAALASAYEAMGNLTEVHKCLQIELEATRGPKRKDVLKRLGTLRQERMNDLPGALEAFEGAIGIDPADDDVRTRYASLAVHLGGALEAARTFARVSSLAKDAAVRARIAAEMGDLLRLGGDLKRARSTFVSVLGMPSADPVAVLKAARALADVYAQEKDLKSLADVLDRIGHLSTDGSERDLANERLAVIAQGPLSDDARAIAAWERLRGGESHARALQALRDLFEKTGDVVKLSEVLEQQAEAEPDEDKARAQMFDAARLVTESKKDPGRAADAWAKVVARFGDSKDVLAMRIPLLEALGRFADLAQALESDARLSPEGERAPIFARLGQLHLTRTRDPAAAVDAFRRALAADPGERTARGALEKMLGDADQKLLAAEVLEPLYRLDCARVERARQTGSVPPPHEQHGAYAGLIKVLGIRAEASPIVSDRLAALDEATRIAEEALPERALDFAGRGLAEAVASEESIDTWLATAERIAARGVEPKRYAAVLSVALGGARPIDSAPLFALAKTAAEAHARSGDVGAALALYRRALPFDPASQELLDRIDELLREQGNPEERVALYRAALEKAGADKARRQKLLHAIASIERFELNNGAAAITAYGAALRSDPTDRTAYGALVELYTEASSWDELCDLLEDHLEHAEGEEARRTRSKLAQAAAQHGQATRAALHATALLADGELTIEHIDAVVQVAETVGDQELLRRAMERRVEAAIEPRDRTDWLERLAELYVRRERSDTAAERLKEAADTAQGMGDDALAQRLHERVLSLFPTDVESTRVLADLYERSATWDKVPPLLRILADAATDDAAKAALLVRQSQVLNDHLSLRVNAARAAAEAFALVPSDRAVIAVFEQLAQAAGQQELFATAVDLAVPRVGDRAVATDLALAKARLLADTPGRVDAVAATYRDLLADPGLDDARKRATVAAFEALLARPPRRLDDVRWLCAWRHDHATEEGKGAALLEWARVEEKELGDLKEALNLYRRAVALEPYNEVAATAVARLSLELGDVDEALSQMMALRDQSEGEARVERDIEIATILLERKGKADLALDRVAEVLERAPGSTAALALAEKLLGFSHIADRAIAVMQKALEGAEDGATKAQLLEDLLGRSIGASSDVRNGWYLELVRLQSHLDQRERAFSTALVAARELPARPGLWNQAEELARQLKSPEPVAEAYEDVLSKLTNSEVALEIGQRAVAFYEEWFDEPSRVVAVLERILQLDPLESWAFDRLKLLFDSNERWDDLFALYDRAIAATQGAARIDLLEEVAQIAKDFANHSERAIGYLEQLLELKPGNARLSAALERLYERHGRFAKLVGLLQAQLGQLGAREAQETRAKIAGLWLDQLTDATNALLVIEDLLAHEPSPLDAGIDVCDLLERVLALAPPNAELRESSGTSLPPAMDPPRRDSVAPVPVTSPKRQLVRQRAAALLKEHYTAPGREADLVRVLEVELEAVKSVKERIRRHQQIAALYGDLGRPAEALDHVVQLVLLEPEVVSHRDKLAELAGQVGRFDRMAEVLIAAADDSHDESLKVELLTSAGRVSAEQLADSPRAIELFFRVLLISPISDAQLLTACRLVTPLLEAAGRDRERLDVLERLAMLETDPDVRWEVLGTTATLAQSQGELDRAIWAWETRLEVRQHDPDALDGLVTLFARAERWPKLIRALRARSESERPTAEQLADRVHIARILAERLGATRDAIEAWRDIAQTFGESDETTTALSDLYTQTADFASLATLFEGAADRAKDDTVRARYCRELGDVYRTHLARPREAVESYARALAAVPGDERARAGLAALLSTPSERGRVTEVLLNAFRATDEWASVLGLLEHRLETTFDLDVQVGILRESATIAEERAGDLELAFGLLRRAFLLAPHSTEVEADLSRLADATREWRSLAEARREIIESFEDRDRVPDFIGPLRFRLAELLETRLEDGRGALSLYQRVAQDSPRDTEALTRTIRVAGRVMRWDAAARALADGARASARLPEALVVALEEAAISAGGWDAITGAVTAVVDERQSDLTPGLARDLEALVARWHRDRRTDPDSAEAAFARALAHDPMNAELLSELAQLQRRAKGRPLIESLLRLSQATGGDLDLLSEAAEIALTTALDRALAKSILERMLRLSTERWLGQTDLPSSGEPTPPERHASRALEELVRVYRDDGDVEKVAELLVENAKLPFAREKTRQMRLEAAKLKVARLSDPDAAVAIYEKLLDEDAHDVDAIGALVELFESSGRRADLLALKRRLVNVARTLEERCLLRLEVAQLEDLLGSSADAVESLRLNLADAPRHAGTVSQLGALLARDARYAELEALYASQAAAAEADGDRASAVDAWLAAAEVAEQKMSNPRAAKAHFQRVIPLEERPTAVDALARLSVALGELDEAARYLDRLREASRGKERAAVTLRLADVLVKADQAATARARLEAEIELQPDAEVVRGRLSEMYRARGEWLPLAELLTRGAEHAPDKATRLLRLREASELYRARCGLAERAVPLLEQASDLDPDDRTTKLALADALGSAGRIDEARGLLRVLIDGFGGRRPKERAPVHYYLAMLDLKVGDRARALVELDSATRIDPANPEILRALAELARDDGQLERAERSYRALLTVLRRHEGTESAVMSRSEVLVELADIANRQGQEERAHEILESAFEASIESALEAERLERALVARGDAKNAARALEARLVRTREAEGRAKIYLELAPLYEGPLARPDDALASWLQAVTLTPASDEAHAGARTATLRAGKVDTYLERLRAAASAASSAADTAGAAKLLTRIAVVLEEDVRDDRAAAAAYEKVLEVTPEATAALHALDRIYERLDDEDGQTRILTRRIDMEGAGDTTPLYRLCGLYLKKPATVDDACATLERILPLEKDEERFVRTLESACDRYPKHEGLVALFERIARAPGKERQLVDALMRRWSLDGAGSSPAREAIQLAQSLPDPALAESLLRRFLEVPTDDPQVRAWGLCELADYVATAGDVSETVLLKREAAEISEPDAARKLLFEVASLAMERLGDTHLATSTYEELHEREPSDREAWQPLITAYRQLGESEKLAELIGEVQGYVDDDSERMRLRFERVKIRMERMGLGDAALPELQEIVNDDPTLVEAAILLSSIYERQGREEELAHLLERQLETAKDRGDAPSIASLSRRLGSIVEKKDRDAAKAIYYGALDWDPAHAEILRALAGLHAVGGADEAAARADVLERLLPLIPTGEVEALALDLSVVRADLWDVDGALRALEYGFEIAPQSRAVRDRLENLYLESSSHQKLAELYTLDAEARTVTSEKVDLLLRAAKLYRDELADPELGATVLAKARDADPGNVTVVDLLVEMLAASGELAAASAEITKALEAVGAEEHARRARLLCERAGFRSRLSDDEGALADWDEATALGHDKHLPDLAAHLNKMAVRAAGSGDTPRWRALRVRLAELLPRLGDVEEARTMLTELLRADSRDRVALRLLGRIEESTERWDAASAVYRRLVGLEEGELVVEAALKLAETCERAGRFGDARGGLERARLAAPTNQALRDKLERVYEETGATRELAELYLADAHATLDVGGKFALLVKGSTLLLSQGQELDVAVAALEEARALRPSDLDCVAILADAYTHSGRLPQAQEVLQTCIASFKGRRSRELSALYHRLARVAEATGDKTSELSHLTSALDMDAQNGVVASELAYLAMELSSWDVATRALRTITMLKTAAPLPRAQAYHHLGEIARHQGDARKAIMLLRRALDEDASLTAARALLEELEAK